MIKFINIITLLCISVLFCSSCKDDEQYDFSGDNQNKVFFKTIDNTVNGYDKISLKVLQTVGGVFCDQFQLLVYSTKPADGDIYVSTRIAQELVEDYNLEHGTDYPVFPINAVKLVNNNLNIPSNSLVSKDAFKIEFISEALENVEEGFYLLPLVLNEVTGNAVVSTNRGTVYLLIDLSVDKDNICDIIPEEKGELYSDERIDWKAEAFNSYFGNDDTSIMFDGDESNSLSYTLEFNEDKESGFIIDMQKVIGNISGIYEKFYWDSYAIVLSDIYTSVDKEEWIYQGSYTEQDDTSEMFFYAPIEARYIKVVVNSRSRYRYKINEFNIYVKNN
ncbi:BT_3987 domain-containing protein [Phocaeicola sp.]|uniref:BT_3987 domain-containing protein n=1 Tax=Phocaeicola sp. TaxID=2773926 RepID=UPI003868B21E